MLDHVGYVEEITKAHLRSENQVTAALKKFKEATSVVISDTVKKLKSAGDNVALADVNKVSSPEYVHIHSFGVAPWDPEGW